MTRASSAGYTAATMADEPPTPAERRAAMDAAFEVATAFKTGTLAISYEDALRVLDRALYLKAFVPEGEVWDIENPPRDVLDIWKLASDIQKRIFASLPFADGDDDPPATPRDLLRPSLLVTPPPWRTYYRAANRFVGEKVIMKEDGSITIIKRDRRSAEKMYRRQADNVINRAARTVIANPGIAASAITAMQMVEHCWARGELLSDVVLKALAFALGIGPHWESLRRHDRIRRGREAGEAMTEVSAELGFKGTRTTRARKPNPMKDGTRAEMIDLYDRVAASRFITTDLRREIAEGLGLLGDDGDWHAGVHEHLLHGMREPDEFRRAAAIEARARLLACAKWANGLKVTPDRISRVRKKIADCRSRIVESGGDAALLNQVLLDQVLDFQSQENARVALWNLFHPPPRDPPPGREPPPPKEPAQVNEDQELEALILRYKEWRRLRIPALNAKSIAAKLGDNVDHRKIGRWMARPEWEQAVRSQVFYMQPSIWVSKEQASKAKRTLTQKP